MLVDTKSVDNSSNGTEHSPCQAAKSPLVVAYGMGVDSTAMLVGMHQRGIRPDKILFADTGSEKPDTYAYLPIIQAWLASVGFPSVEVVQRHPTKSRKSGDVYTTLEENCLQHQMLPSLAYGRKGCSLKWKREPQDKHVARWDEAKKAWKNGLKVTKAIGYDAGPKDSKRAWNLKSDAKYEYIYPLRDWGWDREACIRAIQDAGLPVPVKSACFFCPAMKPGELEELVRNHPEYAARIIEIEKRAAPNLKRVEGLWIRTVKGHRGATPKPGSMTVFLKTIPWFQCPLSKQIDF